MSAPWPAPVLRERQNDLGWLALSPPEDDIRIGVTGATRQEAEASYADRRAVWQALQEAREAEGTRGAVTANHDHPDRDERVSLAPLDPEEALRALLRVDPESEPVQHRDDDRKDDAPD